MSQKIVARFFEDRGNQPRPDLDLEDGNYLPSVGDIIVEETSEESVFYEVAERHLNISTGQMAVILKRTHGRAPFSESKGMTKAKITGL